MQAEKWEELVRRLEPVARANPRGYRARVAALGALGYAYIGFVVLILVAAIVAIGFAALASAAIIAKLALPLIVLIALIGRSLWVSLPEPEGIPLSRKRAPELFALIDEVRKQLKAPRIHRLVVDPDLNAAIVQRPRFGTFGPSQNYLVLGLPLLRALSVDEFRAVLAHELGHVSANHGRFLGWIYRLRQTWVRLLDALEEQEHWGAFVFRRFFSWYAPYFNAYSFALARADEYVADSAAVDATDRRTTARALVDIELAARELDRRFWPKVFEGVERQVTPPRSAFRAMADQLPVREGADVQTWVKEALAAPTGLADTHPALRDRLAALEYDEGAALALLTDDRSDGPDAAEELLTEALGEIERQLDEDWHMSVARRWAAEHEARKAARARLAELEERRDPDELEERADLTAQLDGVTAAAPLFRELVAAQPQNPLAHWALAQVCLDEDRKEKALEHLEVLLERPGWVLQAVPVATALARELGRTEDIRRYEAKADEEAERLDAAQRERASVEGGDQVAPHGLPDDAVEAISESVRSHRKVKRAWLARKKLEHFPDDDPVFIVGIEGTRDGTVPDYLVEQIEKRDLQIAFWVVLLRGRYSGLGERLKRLEGAQIVG